LELSDATSEVANRDSADVKKLPEFMIGDPAEISKAVVAGTVQRSDDNRPQAYVVLGHLFRIIQSNVHPVGALRGAEHINLLFLPQEESG